MDSSRRCTDTEGLHPYSPSSDTETTESIPFKSGESDLESPVRFVLLPLKFLKGNPFSTVSNGI